MKKIAVDYRRITEALPQGVTTHITKTLSDKELHAHFPRFIIFFLMSMFVFLVLYVGFSYIKYQEIRERRLEVSDNYDYWKDVVRDHPNLPDAYYNAGFYAYRLGDKISALDLLDRAIELDPSFDKALKLSRQLTDEIPTN